MKKIFKSLFVAALLGMSLTSCDEADTNVFDGPVTNYYDPLTYSINATDDENKTVAVKLITTTVSAADRSYAIEVDPTSTATLGTDFTLSANTITIPANSYSGTVDVTSILTPTTFGGATVKLNLVAANDIAQFDNVATVNISHNTCIVGATMYTGDYTIEQVSGSNGFGDAFDATQVTLTNTGGTNRSFDAVYLLDVGQGPMTFNFDLSCAKVVPAADQFTGLNCGTPINLTSAGSNNSSYNPFSDTELFITLEEVIDGCPVANASTTTIKLTKI